MFEEGLIFKPTKTPSERSFSLNNLVLRKEKKDSMDANESTWIERWVLAMSDLQIPNEGSEGKIIGICIIAMRWFTTINKLLTSSPDFVKNQGIITSIYHVINFILDISEDCRLP